ncbi:hypothetical protein RN001_011288 [Aquatica leii]|uniref:Large ribosomal subunit protein bL34m n=1 Tax=Aquatica leii TaxID=1421715 RepID=A0AAN7PXM7_9COLE|nr:hypothetical protein RN001_011288 [Aquatica leii]
MFVVSKLLSIVSRTSFQAPVSAPGGLYDTFVRYNIRNHFPRPSERKRIKVHGWKKRMSTPGGQRVIMRRILKGSYVYTH